MPPIEPVSSRFVGEPRLLRLLADTDGDLLLSQELFAWNVRASGAAMEAIHVFELILRNAIDRELRTWNEGMDGTPEWLLHPHPYLLRALNPSELSKTVSRARRIAAEHGRPVNHDDVLAQMSLGAWRYILPSKANKSKQKLWKVAIKNAFPAWPGNWPAESIVTRVANVHGLRNRVAHLEPLHRYDLRRVRRDMRSVCHAVGPDAARFFVQTERLLPIIESNPASPI
ncbi:hypothetical protein DY023_16570 [Microbacterium bovistercoris]|uniref:Abi-like protein n=1 Tax=Microbacterium bovistercoris TaxID=2293570 RepID=A0A371NQH0_9MICO|nr:hypothetical protein [Microbacterium bovistercoris]REJ03929.1 hypothetical protein DY023_16570 [Microbacterium bovistercoris]